MCGATETLELAIAAHNADIAAAYADGTPIDEDVDSKMDWKRAMAFRDVHVEQSPFTNSMSDIDGHQVNVPARRQPLGQFTLFAFSAKFDPVATMLVQDHRTVIPDYYGVTTSFNKAVIKPGVTVLAYEEGAPWVKYIHGDYGKGSLTFLGGHDPEDPQHNIGNAPTDLALHPTSPGYRLILNNVLFPAAKKKPLKTCSRRVGVRCRFVECSVARRIFLLVPPSAVSEPKHSRLALVSRRRHASRHPARRRTRGVLRLHDR